MATIEDEASAILNQFFKDNHIEIIKTIGTGSYSKVQLANVPEIEVVCAIKVIDKRENGEYVKRFLPRELEIVKALNHVNVCKVFKVLEPTPFICIVNEFCEGGDLLQKITTEKRISEPDSMVMFRQLIEALSYLSNLEIVHRDLKCENIFLDKFENVKLGDFGFARYLKMNEKSSTFCGSRAYVAPEILRSVEYTGNTVDIWSAGVVLFVMVTGAMPYDDRFPQKMVERMLSHKLRFPKSVKLTMEVRMLIYEILHPYPPNRPTYTQMKSSPWLTDTQYIIKSSVSKSISRAPSIVQSNNSSSGKKTKKKRSFRKTASVNGSASGKKEKSRRKEVV